MTRRFTQVLVLVVVAGLVLYNIAILIEPTPNDTISAVVRDWLVQHPVVGLAIGVLMGHLAWPLRRYVPEIGPYVLALWGGIAAVADWCGWLPAVPPIVSILFGIVLGGLLWGQTKGS